MRTTQSDLMFDYDSIPNIPCSVYFYNSKKEIDPKQVFTITQKRINHSANKVEIFILEFNRFIEYNSVLMYLFSDFNPN